MYWKQYKSSEITFAVESDATSFQINVREVLEDARQKYYGTMENSDDDKSFSIELGSVYGYEFETVNSDIPEFCIKKTNHLEDTKIAIGRPYYRGGQGCVRIYNNEGNQIGQDLTGYYPCAVDFTVGSRDESEAIVTDDKSYTDFLGDEFGSSLAWSHDGKYLAIGAPKGTARGEKSGYVSVYTFDDNSERWIKVGHDIAGKKAGDEFGTRVQFDPNNSRLLLVQTKAIKNQTLPSQDQYQLITDTFTIDDKMKLLIVSVVISYIILFRLLFFK